MNLEQIRINLGILLNEANKKGAFDLEQANAAAKEISLDTARKTEPVVLHRGAVKALDDLNAPK